MHFDYDAFIFDLDGVLTETQELHARAWKKMFNEFIEKRKHQDHPESEDLRSFTEGEDYRKYLDGKPRLDGVRSFLASRKIKLRDQETQELGLIKNGYYQNLLKEEGPGLIFDSFSFLQKLKEKSIPMAVVSSSRNCRMIVEETGMNKYLTAIVDPEVAEKKKLRGKPEADYFIEATRILGTTPEKSIMVEDALSGVEAGKKGHFKKVVGINIYHDEVTMKELKKKGADEVVTSLWDIPEAKELLFLPDAIDKFNEIFPIDKTKEYFLFLDYDGTISDIVKDPGDAHPLEGIKDVIAALSQKFYTCIITGRDTPVIKKMLDIPGVYYAACHGFEITGPKNTFYELDEAVKLIPYFDEAQSFLSRELAHVKGIVIERKKFGLAFHYRMVTSIEAKLIIQSVHDYCKIHSQFKAKLGEEVIEMLPNLAWDKGKALQKLYEVLNVNKEKIPPLYFGDGKTDEDAFREMSEWGIPILVNDKPRPTLARFILKGPLETKKFLEKILNKLENIHGPMDS